MMAAPIATHSIAVASSSKGRPAAGRGFAFSVLRNALALVAMPFLLSSTCPTEEPALPPRLHAPVFIRIETGGYKTEGEYREAVHLVWKAPNQDSNTVASYKILRNARGRDDTVFSVAVHSIPASVTEYFDPIGDFGFPPTGAYSTVAYRITSIDAAGQEGDTSAIDSFVLIWQPLLESPLDTLRENLFAWSMTDVRGSYRSHMMVWSSSGIRWTGPLSDPVYPAEGETVRFSSALPDTLWPLPAGVYFFGARVIAYAGEKWNREGIAISGPLYVF